MEIETRLLGVIIGALHVAAIEYGKAGMKSEASDATWVANQIAGQIQPDPRSGQPKASES